MTNLANHSKRNAELQAWFNEYRASSLTAIQTYRILLDLVQAENDYLRDFAECYQRKFAQLLSPGVKAIWENEIAAGEQLAADLRDFIEQ